MTSPRLDDSKPFNPKVVKYEIFGPASYADINYLDLGAKPKRVDGAALPWSLVLSTTAPSVFPNIVAQGDGDTSAAASPSMTKSRTRTQPAA